MKLGAYYWDGWYEKLPHWSERLRLDFSNRMPPWGWLGDTIENMELQIDIAANAGLHFFAFDWYYPQNGTISGMNDCVDRFLKAKNNARMRQCLLIANHEGGRIFRDKWEDFCRMVLPYLTNELVLKINEAPVLIFFSPAELRYDLGGEEEARKCILYLKELVRKEGIADLCIVAGCPGVPRDEETGAVSKDEAEWKKFCHELETTGFDAVSGYNYHRPYLRKGDNKNLIYPFEALSEDYERIWDAFAQYLTVPYMPCVNGGWDCRPWERGSALEGLNATPSCYSPDRTPYSQYAHVKNAGIWLKANANKALSDLAIIYAWNENGEGGFIVPTIGDQGTILNAISRAVDETR